MVTGRHRRRPTLREALTDALNRASMAFVIVMTCLVAWNLWPTDGTAPHEIHWNHFHLRHLP